MQRVVIESPYAGKGASEFDRELETERNLRYLRACMRDCLVNRNESPYGSHGLYTQPGVLDDKVPAERTLGINAGFVWGHAGDKRVFYMDRGMSTGMKFGMEEANRLGQKVEERTLGANWEETFGGVLVPPSLAAELRVGLKSMKQKYTERAGFSNEFIAGYQQGLAEARDYVSGPRESSGDSQNGPSKVS